MFLQCNFLSGPDHRLVRLLGRVSPLECEDFLLFHRIIQFIIQIFVAWNRVHCASFQVRKKQRTLDELSDLSSDPYAALEKVQFLFLQPTLL